MTPTVLKALRRLLVCAVVITAVLSAFVLFMPEEAVAAICCDGCDVRLALCLDGCGGVLECEDTCFAKWNRCYTFCVPC